MAPGFPIQCVDLIPRFFSKVSSCLSSAPNIYSLSGSATEKINLQSPVGMGEGIDNCMGWRVRL